MKGLRNPFRAAYSDDPTAGTASPGQRSVRRFAPQDDSPTGLPHVSRPIALWAHAASNRVNPFPIILSAPSGGGKTTIARELLRRRADVGYSVSCTTRNPRGGERDGVDYYFLDRDEFLRRRAAGDFAESAEVHGNLYGTLRTEIDRVLGLEHPEGNEPEVG